MSHERNCERRGHLEGSIKEILTNFDLSEDKICGITTDGAAALTGRNKRFVSLLKSSIGHAIVSYHCITHKQQLCAKVLNMKEVLTVVVEIINFIRARGLNHRQLKNLLEECGSDYEDVVYFSHVRWLSRAATLKRFWNLIPEIKQFLVMKHRDITLLENCYWLNDLALLIDITQILSDLKLEGKELTSGGNVLRLFYNQCGNSTRVSI